MGQGLPKCAFSSIAISNRDAIQDVTSPKAPLPSKMRLPFLSSSKLRSPADELPSFLRAACENLKLSRGLWRSRHVIRAAAAASTAAAKAAMVDALMMVLRLLAASRSAQQQIHLICVSMCLDSSNRIMQACCDAGSTEFYIDIPQITVGAVHVCSITMYECRVSPHRSSGKCV